MDYRKPAAAALAVLLVSGVAFAQNPDPRRGQRAAGETLAERNCAQCHAAGEKGDSPNATAPRLRELGERYPFEDFAAMLRSGMLRRHPAMPELRLNNSEIESLIVYLRGLQTRQAAQLAVPGGG